MPAGRPTDYNEDVANRICEQLIEGVPLKRICAADDMPCYVTVLRWQKKFPEFGDLLTRAKQEGTHSLADECLSIADRDDLEPANKRVMIDTRLRLIGKWNSRAYGEKVEHTGSGENGEIVHAVEWRVVNADTDSEGR